MEYKDGAELFVDKKGEKVIFNFKSWISLVKGIKMNYADKTEEEADNLIQKANFAFPKDYIQVIYYSHEIEYHWAMLAVYGKDYWQNGVNSIPPSDYDIWEKTYKSKHFLKSESIEFLD